MNSSEIFQVIEEIAGTASKTAKENLISRHGESEEFRRVLLAALNPFVTYGIKKLPEPDNIGHRHMIESDFVVLNQLAARVLTGNQALAEVNGVLMALEPASRELFKRILLKDLRAGFSESTVNKAIPGLVPTFDCMLAHPYKEHKHKLTFPLYVEPKLDGVRVLTFVTPELDVRFFSRSGKEFTTFDHLKEPVYTMVQRWIMSAKHTQAWFMESGGLVLESEVVSGSFNKTVSEVRRKNEQATDAVLYLFDLLPMSTFKREDKRGDEAAGKWAMRRLRLIDLCTYKNPDDPMMLNRADRVENEEGIHKLYEEYRAQGLEGVIVKDPLALYHRRRNHAWSKIKAEESVDVVIVDCEEGKKGTKNEGKLGALVVDYKGVRVSVGSGFEPDQETREEFWSFYKQDLASPPEERQLLGRLIEVEFHEVTPDGSLRHPRFKRFRDDKPVQEAA